MKKVWQNQNKSIIFDLSNKQKTKIMTTYQPLTIENASKVSTVINIANPDWGTKKFNYNDQPLQEGRCASTVGAGVNSSVLFEDEYKFWAVASWKN